MVIIVFIILLIITGQFTDIFTEITGKTACTWSFLTASITSIPPECKMKLVDITVDDLEKPAMDVFVSEQFKRFNLESDTKYKDMHFTGRGDQPKFREEFALDKLMADELKDCWDKVGHGRVAALERWWSYFKCGDDQHTCSKEEIAKDIIEIMALRNNDITNTPPRLCIMCSRIKFDEGIRSKFTDVSSLDDMMKNTPMSPTDLKSYYQYVYEDGDMNKGIFAPTFDFTVQKPYAVVYSRVNVDLWAAAIGLNDKNNNKKEKTISETMKVIAAAAKFPIKLEDDMHQIKLIPYNEEVRNHCTHILNY